MSGDRGHYGPRSTAVGYELRHVVELTQSYTDVTSAAMQGLLTDLAGLGAVRSISSDQWEVALSDGAWAVLAWSFPSRSLKVSITDRRSWPSARLGDVRNHYEAILAKIEPRLLSMGSRAV